MSNSSPPVHHPDARAPYDAALAQGLSHDLRAPLRAIDSFAVLLGQHLGDELDSTGRSHLQRIRDAASRIGTLLEALQELGAAGRATLRRDQVDLGFLADWVGADLQALDPARTLELNVADDLLVEGDEHYLRRMLWQLLHNAWKFAVPGEPVRIEVTGARRGDRLHLQIRDAGIGFDPQYAGKLFIPFQRLHGADQGAGAGLGLAIAQCIAQRHGGTIRADAAPGEAAASGAAGSGSVFHVDLPLSQPDPPAPHPTPAPQGTAAHG